MNNFYLLEIRLASGFTETLAIQTADPLGTIGVALVSQGIRWSAQGKANVVPMWAVTKLTFESITQQRYDELPHPTLI